MKSYLSFFLVMVLSAVAVQAQTSPRAIVDRAQSAYETAFEGVNSYMITTEVIGTSSTVYAERVPGGGPINFVTYTVMPDGQLFDDDDMFTSLAASDVLEDLAANGRYGGEHQINGETALAIEVDDFNSLIDPSQLPDEGEFELESGVFYFSSRTGFLVGFDATGTMDDSDQPVNMSMRFSDYRTVSGLTWPHLMTMSMEGVMGSMSAEDRAEMEEVRRQLAEMPPEQREMLESMMGDQLAQFDAMLSGEAVEFEAVVTDVQVNVPRP